MSGNNIATLANGTYCFHNVSLTNSAQLKVNGPVVIKLTGAITASGATSITNTARNSLGTRADGIRSILQHHRQGANGRRREQKPHGARSFVVPAEGGPVNSVRQAVARPSLSVIWGWSPETATLAASPTWPTLPASASSRVCSRVVDPAGQRGASVKRARSLQNNRPGTWWHSTDPASVGARLDAIGKNEPFNVSPLPLGEG